MERCECQEPTPFWDEGLEKCVNNEHCNAKQEKKQCPALPNCSATLKAGYHWVTAPYNTIKDLDGCLVYPCGIQKPLLGCIVPHTGRFVNNGWEGAGEGDRWCAMSQAR